MNQTEENVVSILPHGSGIDCKWYVDDMGKYFRCKNSYHCMNEHGYYDGYADFTVIIPKNDLVSFRLHFNGSVAQYKNQRYMLRDYLEDTIYFCLSDWLEKQN